MSLKESLLTATLLAFAAFCPTVSADDWRDKEDGVLYLTSDDPFADEYFIVERINDEEEPDDDPDWKIHITYYRISASLFEVDTAEYGEEDIDRIDFEGDANTDGFYNYTDKPSVAFGHGGADYLVGGDADDDLFGGPGNDVLQGGDGRDDLYGERGRDSLYGGEDNDYLHPGTDPLEGTLLGEGGFDVGVVHYSDYLGWFQMQEFFDINVEAREYRRTIFFTLTYQYRR